MGVNGAVASLSHLGNVPRSYKHEWRVATPRAPIVLPNSIFKWYHVHREGSAVPDAMDAAAQAMITGAMVDGA